VNAPLKNIERFEAIEAARFLGREFILWLWWATTVDAPLPDGIVVELCGALTLERVGAEVERTAMRGVAPSSQAEAMDALRDGKMPTSARLYVTQNEKHWSFVLHADRLVLTGLKVPALLTDKEDDGLAERLQLTRDIEGHVDALFAAFVRLRTSDDWPAVATTMRAWVRGAVAS